MPVLISFYFKTPVMNSTNRPSDSFPVRVIKGVDSRLTPDPTGPLPNTRRITCGAVSLGRDIVTLTGMEEGCKVAEPGDIVSVSGPDTVTAERIRLEDGQRIWVFATDFADFQSFCNDCCGKTIASHQ